MLIFVRLSLRVCSLAYFLPCSLLLPLPCSLPLSLTPSLAPLLTSSLTPSLTSSLAHSLSRSPALSRSLTYWLPLSVYRTFYEPAPSQSHDGSTNPFSSLYVRHINTRSKHSLKFMSCPLHLGERSGLGRASAKLMQNHYSATIGVANVPSA